MNLAVVYEVGVVFPEPVECRPGDQWPAHNATIVHSLEVLDVTQTQEFISNVHIEIYIFSV